jgi:hypothetical protein
LQGVNGKYVSEGNDTSFQLKANSSEVMSEEMFTILPVGNLTTNKLLQSISGPKNATGVVYNSRDSNGNYMHCISVIELKKSDYSYAAVYHSSIPLGDSSKFNIHLSVSNDLTTWTYVGLLIENADMPEIKRVKYKDSDEDSEWIVLIYEQWESLSVTGASAGPARIGFKLFYDEETLLNLTINSHWTAPESFSNLNGTPNIYRLNLVKNSADGNYVAEGEVGFHFFDTQNDNNRDLVASAKVENLFNPDSSVIWIPKIDDGYNSLFFREGGTGNIGQRASIVVDGHRYNLQEVNLGRPQLDWDKWRIFLYVFEENSLRPTGNGAIFNVFPQTEADSKSFGNPRISVVKSPNHPNQKSLVISYFIFTEGSKNNEAGGLLFYFDL